MTLNDQRVEQLRAQADDAMSRRKALLCASVALTTTASLAGAKRALREWDGCPRPTILGMSFLGLGLLQWTALAAIAGFVLAAAAIATIIVTVCVTRADRRRDDTRRQEDRQWDSDRRQEDREHDADLRRQDSEREDRLRREEDEKWQQRRRDEQRQREDDDAQQQIVVEFLPDPPLSEQESPAAIGYSITYLIILTAPVSYPVKQLGAQIIHADSNLGISSPARSFGPPVTENGQVRYTCRVEVRRPVQGLPEAPRAIVRFTDRNGNLYYSYLGYTRRFSQSTGWEGAAKQLDEWSRTGPKPDEPAS
jgi:hypothetical protein